MSDFKSWFPNIYFETEKGIIINDDCFNVFKYIPDKSIDMILADLPYGLTARNKWDIVLPLDMLWEEYKRVIKDSGITLLFASGFFTAELMTSNKKMWRYNLVWDKQLPSGFLNANRIPLRVHEDICVFYKKLGTYNPQLTKGKRNHSKGSAVGKTQDEVSDRNTNYRNFKIVESDSDLKYPKSILSFSKVHPSKSLHPTQKPVALLEYLIKTYTNEGDLVLDNTAGVCSTGVAAENTKRRWICIEKEKEYCDRAITRFSE